MHSREGANNPKNRALVRIRIPQTRLHLDWDPHAILIHFFAAGRNSKNAGRPFSISPACGLKIWENLPLHPASHWT
jgi:hypothetical protein